MVVGVLPRHEYLHLLTPIDVEVAATAATRTPCAMTADSPDLVVAKQLLDAAERGEFHFQRIAPGPDGRTWGAGNPRMVGHRLPRRVQLGMHRHPVP